MMNPYSLLINYMILSLSLFMSLLIYIKHIGKIELKSIPPMKAAAYVVIILLSTIPLLFHTNLSRLSKLVVLLFIVLTVINDHITYTLVKGLGILYTISIPFDWLYPFLGWLYIPLFSIAVMVYIFLSILIIYNKTNTISTMIKILFLAAFIIEILILIKIKTTTGGPYKPKEGFIADIFVLFNIIEAFLYEFYIKLRKKDGLVNFLNKKKLLLDKIFTTKEEELNSQTIYSYITQHMEENEEAAHILDYIQLIDISWNIFMNYANKRSKENNIELSFEIGDGDYHILNQMVLTSLLYMVEYLNRGNQNQLKNHANINLEENGGTIVINASVDCCKNKLCYSEENEVDAYMSRYVIKAGACLNKFIDNGKAFIRFTIPISGLNKLDQKKIKKNFSKSV